MKNEFGISKDASVQLIVETCLENGVSNPDQIAYVLATAQHESMNFTRAEEINGRAQARTRGYGGGENYYGRGYVQLTHKENYENFDRLLGLNGKLLADVDLAKQPDTASLVLVVGMRDGLFRAHRDNRHDGYDLNEFINVEKTDFHDARHIINGITSRYPDSVKAADLIEGYARQWSDKVPALIEAVAKDGVVVDTYSPVNFVRHGGNDPGVQRLQHLLNKPGYHDSRGLSLQVDGDLGVHTKEALEAFQCAHGLQPVGHVGPKTREALSNAERTPTPVDPSHPDHALYRQSLSEVHRIDRELGRIPDGASERLAASLARLAKENGLTRVDHVVLGIDNGHAKAGEKVFVVQGRLDDPLHHRVHMKTQLAIDTPVAESFRLLDLVTAQQHAHAMHPAPTHHAQQHAEYRDGPRLIIAP